MRKFLRRFASNEAGAVTVDWVVLTAAVVALTGIVAYATRNSAADLLGAAGTAVEEEASIFD
ncbi:hypothetical protein [Salipiger sp. PrR002]|uniref:hypothetical protein n=1 Tax=Salipiger sp. PrR002 TaxID=2706489 RepID=UPI0013B6F96A|nr:hypothetical protein [Salipiger sp. PrR002]NDW01163.1 hypothetical protein [Salipiger sp. PrR002]NDW58827.1 hypothetical protein [Salipiger sp. PrR004]